MADDNKPVGDALAVIDNGPRQKADFVQLGAVWMTQSGHLMIHMQAEPLAWRDGSVRRSVLVRLRDGVEVMRRPGGNNARRERPHASGAASTSYAPVTEHGYVPPPAEEPEDIPFDEPALGVDAVGHGAG